MANKGNGYNPVNAVQEAIAKSGWTAETFFTHAKTLSKANGFNPKAAAEAFVAGQADPPGPVIQFADWMLTHSPRDIQTRFH
ncbi:MAG: hypothetical protein WCT41_03210 [Candidatus Paceibacterota bacterium]|jgi:hypothetical protein